jgi:hypothetical protein
MTLYVISYSVVEQMAGSCGMQLPQMGGKRKSRRQSKKGAKTRKTKGGASDWNKKVMEIYRELKKKNPAVKLGAAMKEASRRKKKGQL